MLQGILVLKKSILWFFKLFLHERREFFGISSYSRNKRLNSLILQAVSLREKEILCYFKLFEREEVEFFDSSSYLCNKRLNSLVLQAILVLKKSILWYFKLFLSERSVFFGIASYSRNKVEFFDSSSDSNNKGWILSLCCKESLFSSILSTRRVYFPTPIFHRWSLIALSIFLYVEPLSRIQVYVGLISMFSSISSPWSL